MSPDNVRSAPDGRERIVHVLAAATFLIFFQAYMVAPLIPRLAFELRVSAVVTGGIVPVYLIRYGFATLGYGVLSDRVGRARLILGSLAAFSVLTALTATTQSFAQLLAWRLVTGLGASAVVPLGLVVIGASFPFEQRGRPPGWLFGAMAGGMAFGSTFGAVLEPLIGWRMVFVLVGALGAIACLALLPHRQATGHLRHRQSLHQPPSHAATLPSSERNAVGGRTRTCCSTRCSTPAFSPGLASTLRVGTS